MRPRIVGSEHEYTLFSHKMNPRGVDPHRLGLEVLRKSSFASQGEWLENGSRAYFDVGHLEIATSEVADHLDLVRYEKAGERIVDLARLKLEDMHGVKVSAYKNNTDPDGVSYGSHENYCVDRDVDFPEEFIRAFVPHLATRIIYTGAGDVVDQNNVLSPCAYLTSELVSGGNLSNTGILHTRDEPHADPNKYRRLHIIIGDALMSELAIGLRAFTSCAILDLLEDGKLEDAPTLAEPLRDMWHMVETVAPEEWDSWSFETEEGDHLTPMEVQRYYLNRVDEEDVVETGEEQEMFDTWEWILDRFEEGRHDALRPKVEWINRFIAVNEMVERKGGDPSVEIAAAKQYSEINEGRGTHWQFQKDGKVERLVTDEEIKEAIYEPPETRAKARREILDRYEMGSIDWSEMSILTEDGGYERVHLPDPYETEVDL
jgi:proteasome accessory factor A